MFGGYMGKLFAFFITVFFISSHVAMADDVDAQMAQIRNLYNAATVVCDGISDEISKISGVAVANTAVTAAGTLSAGGALIAGIAKADADKQIENLSKQICDIGGCDADSVAAMSDEEFYNNVLLPFVEIIELGGMDNPVSIEQLRHEQTQKIKQSKNLGNWRTGLLAGSVATNVASAIIAGVNKNQSDLIQHIQACNTAVAELDSGRRAVIANGVNPLGNPLLQNAMAITADCGRLNISDVEKIEKNMGVVMGTGIAGAVVGAVGTGTSAAANSDAVRNNNTESGKKHEKTLNTISNVAAGANVVTGTVGTGFNITVLSQAKRLIKAAQLCEARLQ